MAMEKEREAEKGAVLAFLCAPPSSLWPRRPKLVIVMVVCCLLPFSLETEEIPLGSTLRPPAVGEPEAAWSSANNTFRLTFIPDPTRPFLFLAAITYIGSSIPLWTPAPNASVSSSGSLTLDAESGDLRLLNGSAAGSLVWHSSTSGLGVKAAFLDETGNLRLVSTNISTVWQSFDHPTDTLLATQNFTSWHNLTSGSYTFALMYPANLIMTWNDSIIYYNMGYGSSDSSKQESGKWALTLQPSGVLQLLHPLLKTPINVDQTRNGSETAAAASGVVLLRFLRLDSDGNLRSYSYTKGNNGSTITQHWAALSDQCKVFCYCGNMGLCFYNGSSDPSCRCPSPDFAQIDPDNARMGCKRRRELHTCPHNMTMVESKHSDFLHSTNLMDSPLETWMDINRTSECSKMCVANESCVATSVGVDDGTMRCRFEAFSFLSGYQSTTESGSTYFKVCFPLISEETLPSPSAIVSGQPPPPPVVLDSKRWSSRSFMARLIALVVVAVVCVLVLLEFLVWWFCALLEFLVWWFCAILEFLVWWFCAILEFLVWWFCAILEFLVW